MKKENIISKEQFRHLPFLYKYLKVIDEEFPFYNMQSIKLTGKIASVQNENAQLSTFYKCISRF
ncbi:MAG: hypothetical protein IJK22_09165 [Bacteroidales bacterium]|nr:hypothetical protein [Bacteroidales bacterium]